MRTIRVGRLAPIVVKVGIGRGVRERRHVEKDGDHGGQHTEGELIPDDRELFRRAERNKAGHKKRQNGKKEELKTRIEQSGKELHRESPAGLRDSRKRNPRTATK